MVCITQSRKLHTVFNNRERMGNTYEAIDKGHFILGQYTLSWVSTIQASPPFVTHKAPHVSGMETKTSSPFALLQDIWDNPHSSQLFLLSLCKLRQIITVLVTIQNFYSTREVDFGKHPKSSPSFAVQGHCALGVVFRNQLSETGCKKRKTEILHLHLILQL